MHEVEVHIVELEVFQRRFDALTNSLMPWIVKLGSNPDLATGNSRLFDAVADFLLVAVCERSTASQIPNCSFTCFSLTYQYGDSLPGGRP